MQSAPMRRLMNGFNTVSSQSHCCIFAINSSDSCGTFQHLEILKVSWQKKIIKSTFVFETNFNDMYDCSAIQSVRYSVKVLFCMQHARERGVNIELQLRWFLLMVKRIKYWYSLLFDNNSTNKFSFCFMCYSYITGYTGWVLRPFFFYSVSVEIKVQFPSYVGTEFIDIAKQFKKQLIIEVAACLLFNIINNLE